MGTFFFTSTSGKLVAQYSCYHGYILKGASEICEGNLWNGLPPECTGMGLIL